MRTVALTLAPPVPTEAKLVPIADAPEAARQLYEKWIEDPFPTPTKPAPRA